MGVGESESTHIRERKHEALATVRLVNKEGDVIWSTTQESNGAKFRGASADVADKITRQLVSDYERARKLAPHHANLLLNLGNVYEDRADYDKATDLVVEMNDRLPLRIHNESFLMDK